MIDQHDETLARFFDGALSESEATAFEARLDTEPALAAELEAMAFTRDALRQVVEAQVEAADFSNFFAAVEAKLPAEPDAAPVEVPRAVAQGALGERIGAWFRRYWTPMLVGAAAAAGVAWFVGSRAGVDDVSGGSIYVDGVSNDGPQTVLISQPAEDGGTTVIWLLDEEHEDEGLSPEEEDPI